MRRGGCLEGPTPREAALRRGRGGGGGGGAASNAGPTSHALPLRAAGEAPLRFSPLRTPRALGFFLLLLGGYLAALWYPGPFPLAPAGADPAQEFAYAAAPNLILQTLAGLLHLHLRTRHRTALAEGYLQLYGTTRAFPPAAFLVCTGANAVLLAALMATMFKGSPEWPPADSRGTLLLWARGAVTAEAACVAGIAFYYARVVLRHNRRRPPPDAYELLGAVSSVHAPLLGRSAVSAGVAEEQAELIRFLQGRVERLNREVLRLQSERPSLAAGGAGEGGGRAEALESAERRLRAQEQEVRGLYAEREALGGELRDAQRLQVEREAELARCKGIHEQHLEENQRLRSIIQEWSLRNAKLEHRLAVALQGAPAPASG